MGRLRSWAEYKSGFGNVNSEHWLGNDKIHRISSAGNYELRIDMSSFESETRYAQYNNFRLGDEQSNYKLIIGNYSGDAEDSLTIHNNLKFLTYDQDNDVRHDSVEPGGIRIVILQISMVCTLGVRPTNTLLELLGPLGKVITIH